MARGAAKRTMSILNDSHNTHEGDTVPTNIQERGSYPNWGWTHKQQGG